MAEAGRRGPGCAVREQGEQEASPLDQSWLLLHQNEQGHIVEEKDGRCVSDGGGKREGKAKRPTELFEKGSMVEVKGYGYGVVQWMGELEGRNTAGVELEEFSVRGGDGTPEGGCSAVFQCPQGYSLFTPVRELLPDPRFLPVETANPLSYAELEVVEREQVVPLPRHYCQGRNWGIQGEFNSCFVDSTLFGLFALSSEFDCLLAPRTGGQDQGEPLAEEIRSTLLTKIINPLRKSGVVRYEPVLELRGLLEQLGHTAGLTQEEKDPEEFLNLLFKRALSATPFISIQRPQGVEQEFFVQLFLEPDPSLSLPSITDLLSKMFHEQNIKFSQVPNKLLIQVPRYGKQYKMFRRVIPDKTLTINSLCDASCLAVGNRVLTVRLRLLSVLCIETSHYVCFSLSDNHWVFMDSMADRVDDRFNIPSCVDCTKDLEEWVYSGRHRTELAAEGSKHLPELVKRFTQDVYMCVYVEDSTAV